MTTLGGAFLVHLIRSNYLGIRKKLATIHVVNEAHSGEDTLLLCPWLCDPKRMERCERSQCL